MTMILTLLLTLAAGQASDDVLAPARQGMLRCTTPDQTHKTCATLTRYTVHPDGGFDAEVTGMASRPAQISIRYTMPGTVENGALCFVHSGGALSGASFTKPGAKLAPSLQETLRAQVSAGMASLSGKKRCYRDRIVNGSLVSATTLDGVAHPELDRPVLWVRAEDGYKVQ
ncbi:hypothetical protein AB2M62_07585 [Sphingomonas sp. MMS12-HWE2-04]|uniref:hypothetical protein n=1 Tax=Sphingomonas sp. MMS12-HWE2-04 TaxID=3234199 RepID=UPI003850AFB5